MQNNELYYKAMHIRQCKTINYIIIITITTSWYGVASVKAGSQPQNLCVFCCLGNFLSQGIQKEFTTLKACVFL